MSTPALVICDGGISALLAATLEGMRSPPVDAPSEMTRKATTLIWFGLLPAQEPERPWRTAAAVRTADCCQLAEPVQWAGEGSVGRRTAGQAVTSLLLAAGAAAIERGVSRVVWPVNLGGAPGADKEMVLSAVADATDRACAVARLLCLDATTEGLVIETPFVDFSREQIADLAADVDLAVGACWLGRPGSDEREGWERALLAVGVEPPASGVPERTAVRTAQAWAAKA